MSKATISCAGCHTAVMDRQFLKCCICHDNYDLLCANVAEKRFLNIMTKEHKASWKCQACISKQPKKDNTNTPVRSSKESPDNVTLRRGAGPSHSMNMSLPSECDSFPTLDQIRTIVREELHLILSERMRDIVANTVGETVATVFSDTVDQLVRKIAELGMKVERLHMTAPTLSAAPAENTTVTPLSGPRSISRTFTVQEKERKHTSLPVIKNNGKVRDGDEECWTQVSGRPQCNKSTPAVTQIKASVSRGSQNVVQGDLRRPREPVGLLRGTAAPGSTELLASEKQRSFHLYYIKLGTTEDQVKTHISNITEGVDCKIESLKARGPYASFRICVPSSVSDRILAPNNWPENVCVKPWRRPFRTKQSNEEGR
jgi:hypothetical protein